jgi:hypothetical protein
LFILMNWLFESCGKVDSWLSELKWICFVDGLKQKVSDKSRVGG